MPVLMMFNKYLYFHIPVEYLTVMLYTTAMCNTFATRSKT